MCEYLLVFGPLDAALFAPHFVQSSFECADTHLRMVLHPLPEKGCSSRPACVCRLRLRMGNREVQTKRGPGMEGQIKMIYLVVSCTGKE